MPVFEFRRRRSRLLRAIEERVQSNVDLSKRYHEKRWTRRWAVFGWWFVLLATCVGGVMCFAGIAFIGVILNGMREIAIWIVSGNLEKAAVVPVLAGWTILCFCIGCLSVLRIRKVVVSPFLKNWAVNLPLSDKRLIGPLRIHFLGVAFPVILISAGAFGLVGWSNQWPLQTYLGVALMVFMTAITGWLLAEFAATYLPPTPLISSTLLTLVMCLAILVLGSASAPKDLMSALSESAFDPFWFLPPAGWYVGFTGLLPPTTSRSVGAPVFGVIVCAIAFLHLRGTLELRDLQLLGPMQLRGRRRLWVQSWSRPKQVGRFAACIDHPKAQQRILHDRRNSIYRQSSSPRRSWINRIAFPLLLSRRHITTLGLFGLKHMRRGKFYELLWGVWPVLFAIAMLICNQFMTLVAFPKFMRLPMVFAFGLSLIDIREMVASTDKGETYVGFSTARSLFPLNYWHLLTALCCNRLLILWCALPGWLIAIALLLQTDIPVQMIVHPPLIVAVISLTIPFVAALAFSSSNLRASWRMCLSFAMPIGLVMFAAMFTYQIGCMGYLIAMRPDAAWIWTWVASGGIVATSLIAGVYLNRGTFDETVVQLSRTVGRKG